jgi:hypothetical protein
VTVNRKHMFLAAVVMLLFAVSGYGADQLEMSKSGITEFFSAFSNVVLSGDSLSLRRLYSRESRNRTGFLSGVPFQGSAPMSLESFREFLENRDFAVKDFRTESDHIIVELGWVLRAGAPPDKWPNRAAMEYYLVSEKGQPALIRPLDLLTRDWQTTETDLFVFHYPASLPADLYQFEMDRMDELSREIQEYLDLRPASKVSVYHAPDAKLCGQLVQQGPGYAYAVVAWNLIVTTAFVNPHEYVHLLTMKNGSFVNAAFSEGLAVALGGGAWYTPEFSVCQARNLLDSPMFLPIAEVMVMDDGAFLGQAEVTYQEAGAFIKYLLERYGWETLAELGSTYDAGESVATAFRRTYGRTLEVEEEQWIQHLRKRPLPRLGLRPEPEAEAVLFLEDPEGDDHGDGSYRYPTDSRFQSGASDLTHFGVRVDAGRVYFEIGLRNLIEPVDNQATGQVFVPAVTIAINRGQGIETGLQRRCLGIDFGGSEGYDLRIDVGRCVQIIDRYDRAFFSSGNVRSEISRQSAGSLEFSLPTELCGRPQDDWSFFVGVYLANDVGTEFLRIIPWFLTPEPRRYGFGCGSNSQVKPRFVDIFVPEGRSQETILSSWSTSVSGRAEVPMVH